MRRHLDDRVIQRRARLWRAIHPDSQRPAGLWWKQTIGRHADKYHTPGAPSGRPRGEQCGSTTTTTTKGDAR